MMERNIEKHFSEIVQLIRKAKNNAVDFQIILAANRHFLSD